MIFVIDAPGGNSFFRSFHCRGGTSCSTAREFAPGWRVDSANGRSVTAIHVGSGSIISGANLDPANVAHPGHPSLLIGFDDDVSPNCSGVERPAECLNVDLNKPRAPELAADSESRPRPAGSGRASAASTSLPLRLFAATLSGSSQMRMAYSRPPWNCTSPTHLRGARECP